MRTLILFLVGITAGWLMRDFFLNQVDGVAPSSPLRMKGYVYTQPLLICDDRPVQDDASIQTLRNEINSYVEGKVAEDVISTASVYLRKLHTGEEFLINGDEHFYPASLKKLPLAMQYFKESESTPDFLLIERTLKLDYDPNAGTAYPPSQFALPETRYTNLALLELMIRYSDNTGFDVLYPELGEEKFDKIYDDMRLNYPNSFSSREDYMRVFELSLFFRTLYNATYLSAENSEQLLELLTTTDFRNCLVYFLPPEIPVAHKFGVGTVIDASGKEQGELHDCGIIYKNQNHYILCVMTKSYAKDVQQVANVIAEVSKLVFEKI